MTNLQGRLDGVLIIVLRLRNRDSSVSIVTMLRAEVWLPGGTGIFFFFPTLILALDPGQCSRYSVQALGWTILGSIPCRVVSSLAVGLTGPADQWVP